MSLTYLGSGLVASGFAPAVAFVIIVSPWVLF
jgi:hypothetical protein